MHIYTYHFPDDSRRIENDLYRNLPTHVRTLALLCRISISSDSVHIFEYKILRSQEFKAHFVKKCKSTLFPLFLHSYKCYTINSSFGPGVPVTFDIQVVRTGPKFRNSISVPMVPY